MSGDLSGRDIGRLIAEPVGELDEAVGEALADGDAEGDADDVCIFELDAGTLVAVIEEDVEACGFKLGSDLFAAIAERIFANVGDGDDEGEGGDGGRKGVGRVQRGRSGSLHFGALRSG